ncbi:MAG TPA: endolytic transglycosylase MltG [Hydrogenophaga sp.]|uniref:endolytic transglycosylase MltG n=1 Tax=Hydrogenophaga sp. TaxID=1904254 RepID=UPI002C4DFC30|nr:endolytic transglycosylase MltG [Hydrogenophaga sp.]HMN92917.1 endolytic transglycosylase MltG [Hydrogenophaga sp.]HMP09780.1 endolytic transglycosylase MltG [Hydrogenophaga sp.]
MTRWLLRLLVLGVVGATALWALAQWWVDSPLKLAPGPDAEGEAVELLVVPGMSARAVAGAAVRAGVQTREEWLYAWFRWSGNARLIKAGSYEFEPGTSPRQLLGKLVRGEQALRTLTLIEGWNIRQVLAAVQSNPYLLQDLEGVTAERLMSHLGRTEAHPEGRFFPDTYRFPKRTPASAVLRQAADAMDRRLASAWERVEPGNPLRAPEDLLILASIVEKETGLDSDRPMVAGVFANRLRIGMRLQTDPTVIYGLGENFDGRLRRVHLQTDTPYNTYTRAGLPPTPIAMPGEASLLAAARPASTRAMYFVSRGDGSSQFSATLDEHNAAVRRYILNR